MRINERGVLVENDGSTAAIKSMATMQGEHARWLAHNFPNQELHQPILGALEELGELSHAVLKSEQGIRSGNDAAKIKAAIDDALGDIVIYLFSFCNMTERNLLIMVNLAWEEVRLRDWVKYPETGRPPVPVSRYARNLRENTLVQRIRELEGDLTASREAEQHFKGELKKITDAVKAVADDDEGCGGCGDRDCRECW